MLLKNLGAVKSRWSVLQSDKFEHKDFSSSLKDSRDHFYYANCFGKECLKLRRSKREFLNGD